MSDETATINGQIPAVEQKPLICSVSSRLADEQLFGTISRTLVWILLEYPAPPTAKAFEESDLPQPVKNHLSVSLKSIPQSRLLLIRQTSAFSNGSGPALFIAVSHETEPVLYEYHLASYADLLRLDFKDLLSHPEDYVKQRRENPLFLVCTNGRRDPCCARWGVPAFEALSRAGGEAVWQSSHIGGHRFAANVLCFPHAIGYGRVDQGDAENLVGAYRRGQIVLANYRGRAGYTTEAQAAEFYLRSQTGNSQVEAYHLESVRETAEGAWSISFRALSDHKIYRLGIGSASSETQIYESCDSTAPKPQPFYQLRSFEEDTAGG